MEYNNHYAIYGIKYFNVIFCLMAETEMDIYKINLLGKQIESGRSIKTVSYTHLDVYKRQGQGQMEIPAAGLGPTETAVYNLLV